MLSFRPIHVKPTPKCSLSIPYPLIGQSSRSRSLKGQKHILVITRSVFVRFIWNQRQNVHFSIPYPLIGQRTRSRSLKGKKIYFGHNTLSFCPIHMKPKPKCSLFNSLSSDMVTNAVLAKVCALPRATQSGQGKGGTRGAEDPHENWNTSTFNEI